MHYYQIPVSSLETEEDSGVSLLCPHSWYIGLEGDCCSSVATSLSLFPACYFSSVYIQDRHKIFRVMNTNIMDLLILLYSPISQAR